MFIFYRIFVKLAGNQDRHKISDEFGFRPTFVEFDNEIMSTHSLPSGFYEPKLSVLLLN